MLGASALRRELSARNLEIVGAGGMVHELTGDDVPSVIFGRTDDGQHGNFHPTSYRNICANPQWLRRLAKVHTASRRRSSLSNWRWMELDCANSSDALLMNVFCYTRTLRNPALSAALGVIPGQVPQFGFRPGIPLHNDKSDRTEIDMRLGDLLVEAKLTETDFQTAPVRMLDRYRDVEEVLEYRDLIVGGDQVRSYQLIRDVLAAHSTGGSFCVLCDTRRPDLIESWYTVMRTVRSCVLRCRLQLRTWQELAAMLPRPLQRFLAAKYGIACE
jgi:hypothetical protein